jgi:hypothetical protein
VSTEGDRYRNAQYKEHVRKHKQTEGMCLSYLISRLISTTRKKRKGDTCCHHGFSIGPFPVYDPASNNYRLSRTSQLKKSKQNIMMFSTAPGI